MSVAQEIVDYLRRLGVTIEAGEGSISVDGPCDVLTPQVLAELRERKEEILAYLADGSPPGGAAAPDRNAADSSGADTPGRPTATTVGGRRSVATMKKTTEWDEDLPELTEWFRSATLPTETFSLNPWTRVVEPEKFYEALRLDIARQPHGLLAGALAGKLRALREVCVCC